MFSGATYMQTSASQLPAGSQCIAAASSSTAPAYAAPIPLPLSLSIRYLALCHLAVLGDQLLEPMCPRGCAFQHLWPHSIFSCFSREKGLAWLEAPSSPPAPWGWWWVRDAQRGVCAAFKEVQLRAEPWPPGHCGQQQNTDLSSENPPRGCCCCCLFL